jgi:hypothetical protein
MISSYICMGVVLREESAHDSVGGGQGGLVCSLGCWSIFRGFTHSASPLPIVLCCVTPLTPAARLSFRLKWMLWRRGSAVCARLGTHAARTGRAVVLLGGGVCLSGLVLSAPSFRPQFIPPPQTSVLTDSCVSLSLLRCLEACDTGEGRR